MRERTTTLRWAPLTLTILLGIGTLVADADAGPGTVASVQVTPDELTVAVGGTSTLSATALDRAGGIVSDVTFTWTVSDSLVATVTPRGSSAVVTGRRAGSAIVRATAEKVAGEARVTVVAR
jgi:uncharacterized protein YjdB